MWRSSKRTYGHFLSVSLIPYSLKFFIHLTLIVLLIYVVCRREFLDYAKQLFFIPGPYRTRKRTKGFMGELTRYFINDFCFKLKDNISFVFLLYLSLYILLVVSILYIPYIAHTLFLKKILLFFIVKWI